MNPTTISNAPPSHVVRTWRFQVAYLLIGTVVAPICIALSTNPHHAPSLADYFTMALGVALGHGISVTATATLVILNLSSRLWGRSTLFAGLTLVTIGLAITGISTQVTRLLEVV